MSYARFVALGGVAALLAGAPGAWADEAVPPGDWAFYLSMRSITGEASPRFVAASAGATASRDTPLEACDGHIYYLTAVDAAAVNAALTRGDTVQLHMAAPETSATAAAIRCLIQADS